jgi:glycosyltransferase involved in cell wall biosynthesis
MSIPQSLIDTAQRRFDLTDAAAQAHLYALTDQLLAYPTDDIAAVAKQPDAPLEFRLAHKLVDSRRYLQTVKDPLKLGVVFAMWGEQNRLRPKSDDNPNGEDALRVKLDQLAWATAGTPIEWTLYVVDDGCPYGSGQLAQQIAAGHALGSHVRVLFLADALPTETGPLQALNSADDSRKGGAIVYGCMQAIADGVDAVVYTDADNSVHLGQLGLLLRPWQDDNYRVVLGNRKHPDAVLVKQEGRWGIGIKLLRHMQRMVGVAIFSRDIRDTQAAFKLYEASVLSQIIAEPAVFDFSFDTDWILATIAMDEPFAKVPFAFIDSAAESASIAQGPMTTWETLLKGLATAVRARGVPTNDAMVAVLDDEIHSYRDLDLLINHLPPALADATDKQLGDPAVMSPAAVRAWIQTRKRDEQATA